MQQSTKLTEFKRCQVSSLTAQGLYIIEPLKKDQYNNEEQDEASIAALTPNTGRVHHERSVSNDFTVD